MDIRIRNILVCALTRQFKLYANTLGANKIREIIMMKKLFIVLTLLLISISLSKAQVIRSYGLKAGVASTNQSWDWTGVNITTSTHQSLDVGIFVEWLDNPFFNVVTEVHYLQKGANVATDIAIATANESFYYYSDQTIPYLTGQDISYSTQIKYLSIPILAKLRVTWGLITPYILIGPRFDYYLSTNGTFPPDYIGVPHDFNKLTIGGTFGIGIELPPFLPIQLAAEARYSPDFQDCYSYQTIAVRNRSMEFILALRF
jgi:hypothetical protein